jgi:transposase-like protein
MASRKASQKSKTGQDLIEEQLEIVGKDPGMVSFDKSKVECICPNCGRRHTMNIRWIGRGVPRKFCPSCRDRETTSDFEI